MRAKTVKTFELWQDVKAYGTFEFEDKNGQVWSMGGKLYRLFLEGLPLKEREMVLDSYGEYTGRHHIGEIVAHRGHECRVTGVWRDEDKNGITIVPTGGYGFEVDIYDEQL